MNLQQDTEEPYDACPYCLTEITEEEPDINFDESLTLDSDSLESETIEAQEASVETEPEVEEEESVEEKPSVSEESSECKHHLGYLSEKSSKDQIPDECMMCKDIVTCMLKKMNT